MPSHSSHPSVAARPIDPTLSRWLGGGQTARERDALAVAGIDWSGPHTGRLTLSDGSADVVMDAGDHLQLRCAVTVNVAPRALLERCAGASGNVRYAADIRRGVELVADTRVNGMAHLPATLRRIRTEFESGLGSPIGPVPENAPRVSIDELSAAIAAAGWNKEDAVEIPDGFELQTWLEGTRMAVQATIANGSVRMQRTVLPTLPEGAGAAAACLQALLCNARLRGCRIAVNGGSLRVECRLDAEQLNGEWLQFATRAIAAASRGVEPELRMLATDTAVAGAYMEMFRDVAPPTGDNVKQTASLHECRTGSAKLAVSSPPNERSN